MNTSPTGSNALRVLFQWGIVGFITVLCCLVAIASPVFGESAETFLNRMTVKFRRTSHIYLEAQSVRVSGKKAPSDTMDVTLAYGYPHELLQWVRGPGNRQQVLIYRGDTVVVSYPHIDVTRRETMGRQRIRRMVLDQVPFAALFVGLASKSVNADSITVEDSGPYLRVTFRGNRVDRPSITGLFRRESLKPVRFAVRNARGRYRVTVKTYTEETRFPVPVERALHRMQPELLWETQL